MTVSALLFIMYLSYLRFESQKIDDELSEQVKVKQ